MTKPAPHITAMLEQIAKSHPHAPAITLGKRMLSYGALLEESQRIAAGLVDLGLGAGDRMGFWLPNILAYLTTFLACARLGVVCVSINTRFGAAEIGDLILRSGAKTLLIARKNGDQSTGQILSEIDNDILARVRLVIDAGDQTDPSPIEHAKLVSYRELQSFDPWTDCVGDAKSPMAIFTTSGTTKAPKLVLQGQHSLTQHGLDVAASFGIAPSKHTSLQALPLCGVFGLAQAMAVLAGGGHIMLMDPIDVPTTLDLLERHKIDSLFCSDDLIDRLLSATDKTPPFRSLDTIGFAAFNTALTDIAERADARGIRLFGLYGMSECMALFARRDPLEALEDRKKAGGRPLSPHGEFRVCDPDTGDVLAQGEVGALEIKGPSLMLHYDGDSAATADAFSPGGWFRTGDLAVDEGYGSFEFLGRMGDVLRLGGFLVNPLEIEEHLQSHTDIDAAQVVAIPTPQGPRPVAFIICPDGPPEDADLFDHCTVLAKFKRPIRFLSLDAFPVTQSANGVKIQRAKLREMALDALD